MPEVWASVADSVGCPVDWVAGRRYVGVDSAAQELLAGRLSDLWIWAAAVVAAGYRDVLRVLKQMAALPVWYRDPAVAVHVLFVCASGCFVPGCAG